MAKKTKKYLAVVELAYDYDDEDDLYLVEGVRDDISYLYAEGVQCEMSSWLEDLGFVTKIRVVEDKEGEQDDN